MTDSSSVADTSNGESPDVEIPPADLVLATKLAERKGMDVEIYLKTLIHEELTRQANVQPTDGSKAESPI